MRVVTTRGILPQLIHSGNASIAYKARRLLCGEDPASPQMRSLQERIRTSPNVQRLLAMYQTYPRWRMNPYQKWHGPHWTLYSLLLLEYPPGDADLLPMRERVYDWLFAPAFMKFPSTLIIPVQEDRPRRCASQEGNAILYSLTLGLVDERTRRLVDRLVAFQWPDGGWNCDKRPEARTSSFIETLIPLRALFQFGRQYQHAGALAAAERAAEFLLQRRLLFRLRDGSLIRFQWAKEIDQIHYPFQFYDVLYVLQVMAEMGRLGDPRCAEALDLLASKQLPDGGFPLEDKNSKTSETVITRGSFADWGPSGKRRSNPFVTVDALWVLAQAGRVEI